ncbi:MAG TPA: tetratricopeptide repeat protein [Ohtaekwangia sp.]|nr:tetratricopeptide repeat protein [Ohtaekwangia sp.]
MKLPVIISLVLLLAGGTASVHAQQKIDSLEKVLKQELPDTTHVKALLQLSYAYEYVDVAKSRSLTEKAIEMINAKGLTEFKGRAYSSMGSIFRVRGDYRAALNADNTALEATVMLKDSTMLSLCFNNVGYDYYDLGEYDEAYHYFTRSYKIAQLRRDSMWMAISMHNVGRVFKSIGQYDRAMDYITFARKVNDDRGEPFSLSEIGDVLLRKGEYDSAMIYLLDGLAKSKEYNLHGLQPRNMINIAKVFVKKQDMKTALSYYDTAYMLYSRNNDRYGIAEVKLGQGLVQLAMGNYNTSLDAIQRSLELARQQNANVLEIQCYQQLSTLWELKGDYKKALTYFKEFKQLEDTLFSQDMQSKLVRDQLRFETESKDSQIAVLSKQQAEQKDEIKRQEFVTNILVVVMALSGIVLITVYRSGQRRRKINMLLLQHQEETEKRSEELERLNQVKDKFFSIISHDLRSPINALAGMLDLMDKGAVTAEELPVHVKELRVRFNHTRTLLNNLLDWTLLQMDKLNLQPGKIDLHKMVDENILLLGPVQGKDIHILNQIPESTISFADLNTVNLVIRNLITNAIKFTNDGGEVIIRSEDKGNEWLVSVRDNGVGIKPEVMDILFDKTAPYTTRGTANEKGTGLGLILCKEFIEKNGGKIGVESKEGDGSTFFFTLPKTQ